MYDTVNSAFTDVLKREGKVITAYSDNTLYNVIFRRNSDKNKLQDTVTIFYNADSSIHAGQLLKYKDKTYLSINQESAENDTYLKSDLFETNAVMNYIGGDKEYNVPAYAYDVNNALAINNNVLSIVNGNIELLAEDNSITRALKINDCFYALGGYWKINNLIYKDNVIYIYVTREVTSIKYTLDITSDDSYEKGTTAQFTAIAKADNTVITNANIVWSSSDTSIATIDSTGIVTFLAAGDVTFTATWVEHNTITATKAITVTVPVPTSQYICKITNAPSTGWKEYNDTDNIATAKYGSTKVFVAHFFDSTETEVTDQIPAWSIDVSKLTTAQQAKIHLTYNESYPMRTYVNVDADNSLIGLQFTLSLTNSTGTCEVKTVPVTITGLMG